MFPAFCYRMASFIYLLSNPNFNLFHFLQELKKITVILKNFSTVRNRLLQFLPMRDQRRDGLLYLLRFWVTQGHQLISSLLINMWQTMLNIFILTNIRTNKYRISDYWACDFSTATYPLDRFNDISMGQNLCFKHLMLLQYLHFNLKIAHVYFGVLCFIHTVCDPFLLLKYK